MTSWKGIKDNFNRKCTKEEFAAAQTLDITEEESKRLQALAVARMKVKRYYLEDLTDGSVLTDGYNRYTVFFLCVFFFIIPFFLDR